MMSSILCSQYSVPLLITDQCDDFRELLGHIGVTLVWFDWWQVLVAHVLVPHEGPVLHPAVNGQGVLQGPSPIWPGVQHYAVAATGDGYLLVFCKCWCQSDSVQNAVNSQSVVINPNPE